MICSKIGCGKSWKPGEEFPLCINHDCPLREYRRQEEGSMGERIRWPMQKDIDIAFGKELGSTSKGIVENQMDIEKFVPYVLGKQKATTKVIRKGAKIPKEVSFDTKDNMHSEMRAIDFMLEKGEWILFLGTIMWSGGGEVAKDEFITEEPHCGFCTLFLHAMHLPLTKPTKGNFNLAINGSYVLPRKVKEDPYVISRLLESNCYCAFNRIKQMLNKFVPLPSDKWLLEVNGAIVDDYSYTPDDGRPKLSWDKVVHDQDGKILDALWRHIFEAIYKTNQKK